MIFLNQLILFFIQVIGICSSKMLYCFPYHNVLVLFVKCFIFVCLCRFCVLCLCAGCTTGTCAVKQHVNKFNLLLLLLLLLIFTVTKEEIIMKPNYSLSSVIKRCHL